MVLMQFADGPALIEIEKENVKKVVVSTYFMSGV